MVDLITMKAVYFEGEQRRQYPHRGDPRRPARRGRGQTGGTARRGVHVLRRTDGGHARGRRHPRGDDPRGRPPGHPEPGTDPGDDRLGLQEQGHAAAAGRGQCLPALPHGHREHRARSRPGRGRGRGQQQSRRPAGGPGLQAGGRPLRPADLYSHLSGQDQEGRHHHQQPHRQEGQGRPPGAHARRRDGRDRRRPAPATSSPCSASTAPRATPSPTVRSTGR